MSRASTWPGKSSGMATVPGLPSRKPMRMLSCGAMGTPWKPSGMVSERRAMTLFLRAHKTSARVMQHARAEVGARVECEPARGSKCADSATMARTGGYLSAQRRVGGGSRGTVDWTMSSGVQGDAPQVRCHGSVAASRKEEGVKRRLHVGIPILVGGVWQSSGTHLLAARLSIMRVGPSEVRSVSRRGP